MSAPVHIILTGGTINKAYDPLTEKPEIAGGEIIEGYFQTVIKPDVMPTFQTICLKDSLELTPQDRLAILEAIKDSNTNRIIIVHGTSTMPVTAAYLAEQGVGQNHCVVLTGAMIPLKEFAMSDGGFNLGYALAQVGALSNGVYVSMNAQIFEAGRVRKNTETGRFELM